VQGTWYHQSLNILSCMDLDGQADCRTKSPGGRAMTPGYAMVALLVAMSIMSVMLTVAMPVWHQLSQREKEAELIFRGQQYARAIGMFQRRAGPGALPPNLDILVEQKFLRRKFKDPITGEDFQPLISGQPIPGTTPPPGGAGAAPGNASGGRGATAASATPTPSSATPAPSGIGQGSASAFGPPRAAGQTPGTAGATGAVGGIQGVVSKSKAKSIRLYNGRNFYNEWSFMFVPQVQAPGAASTPGGGTGPGGRGRGVNPSGQPNGPGSFGPGGFGGRGGSPTMPPGGRGSGSPSAPPGGRGAPGGPPPTGPGPGGPPRG
jgi:type II secretory pathway pseudopilin PulG